MSLGCGTGHRERKWVEKGDFLRIDGYDISDNSIRSAKKLAEDGGLEETLCYYTGDIHKMDLSPDLYDVIFFEHSLHHFSPLKSVLDNVNKWLKPDGVLIVNEFVSTLGYC